MAHPRDVIKLLHDRYNVLQALEAHPSTKQELLPAVEISRSTLDSVMRNLENAGLVVYLDGKWHLTVYGHCAFAVHQRYREQLRDLRKAASLVDMPTDETAFGCSILIDADVHSTDGMIQEDVMQVLLDAASDATQFPDVHPACPRRTRRVVL